MNISNIAFHPTMEDHNVGTSMEQVDANQGESVAVALVSNTGETTKESRRLFEPSMDPDKAASQILFVLLSDRAPNDRRPSFSRRKGSPCATIFLPKSTGLLSERTSDFASNTCISIT